MINEFFKESSVLIIGAKPHNRSGLRKMIADIGCDNRNLATCIDINEALEELQEKEVNVLLIDDDCKDIDKIDSLLSAFEKKKNSQINALIVLITTDGEGDLAKKVTKGNDGIILAKPYTMGTFNDTVSGIILERVKNKAKQEKLAKKEKKIRELAKGSYKEFKSYINAKGATNDDDGFISLCNSFLDSLDSNVDYESLAKILSVGMASKRYQDLGLFVEGWLGSLPVETEQIPDISRVILYNNNFELFKKLKTNDEYACLAIGIGMVISGSVLVKDADKAQMAIEYIETGMRLANYKLVVAQKAFETLAQVGAMDKIKEVLDSPKVQGLIENNEEFKSMLQNIPQIEKELLN